MWKWKKHLKSMKNGRYFILQVLRVLRSMYIMALDQWYNLEYGTWVAHRDVIKMEKLDQNVLIRWMKRHEGEWSARKRNQKHARINQ